MSARWNFLGAVFRKELFEAGRESRVRMMLVTGMLLPLFFGWTFMNDQRSGAARAPAPKAEQMAVSTVATETSAAHTTVRPLTLGMSIGYGMLLAAMTAMTLALESFVGEKERNTLEILFSTPATDRELFLAKLIACLSISIGLGVFFGIVGTVGIVVMARAYGLTVSAGDLAQTWAFSLALLIAVGVTFASLGVIISSRVSTVKAGAQLFGIVFMLIVVLSMVVAALLRSHGSGPLKGIVAALGHMPVWQIISLVLAGVIALNWALLSIAIRTFNREKMLTSQ